jgi:hypothetical protein
MLNVSLWDAPWTSFFIFFMTDDIAGAAPASVPACSTAWAIPARAPDAQHAHLPRNLGGKLAQAGLGSSSVHANQRDPGNDAKRHET